MALTRTLPLGFPVSGINPTTAFVQIEQSGPVAWAGGAFGPEAGLIGLVAIALGCILTFAWVRYYSGKVRLQDELAEFQPLTGGGLNPQENASPNNYP